MSNGRSARDIKRVRNEILLALKVVYPGGLAAETVLRSLLHLFPMLEFDRLRRDLHYLLEKGYVSRLSVDNDDELLTPWRRRWFRLTALGVELAEHCIADPAMEVDP